MEKNEKLKALAAVAESFGLTAKEVIAYFDNVSVLSEETKEASVQSGKAKSTDVVCPGMYYYSDGTTSADILSDKQISGVIGWVDDGGQHGLVLGLQETKLSWSSYLLATNLFDGDGKENTRLIMEIVQKNSKTAEAAEWCAAYAFDGVKSGEAFLPSCDELVKIFRNFDAVQNALKRINKPLLEENKRYWSSSEHSYSNYAWSVRPSEGVMNTCFKKCNDLVRCILVF